MSTKNTETILTLQLNSATREWLAGFLLVGMLLAVPGSLLIAWQYHIDVDPRLAGLHFLGLSAGYVTAVVVAQQLAHVPNRRIAAFACALAFASLLALSFLVPPLPAAGRIAGLAFVGASAGALTTALLHVLQPYLEQAPAAMVNLAGVLFGSGCLLTTAMVGLTYFAGSVQIQTALLSLAPLLFLVLYAANKHPGARAASQPAHHEATLVRDALRDLRSIAAVLFSILLFVQFGNEWAIAGWLPLYLIHRLGSNPVWAIFTLAGYFLALMTGRIAVRSLLPRVPHARLLVASVAVAMIGYLLLSFTTAMPGAWIAVIVIGAGFAPIFPLVAETLDERFSYHPGFYNGLFSLAITGAMCSPWLLGYVDAYLGVRYVMLIPAFGSIAVLVLALLIRLEARLMGGPTQNEPPRARAAAAGKP